MIATGIIYPSEEDTDNKMLSFVEDNVNSYSFSLHSNEWLSFWLFLVASSYFLLSKQVNYFRVRKPQEKLYLSNTTSISNKISENDVYSEISDLDRASYMDCLLSLEEEDSEYWLSDSMSENPSSPLSYISAESFTDISDIDSPSYWDSLLRLEQSEEENGTHFGKLEDNIYNSAEHLLETTDIQEYFTAGDEHEPLFWPYEGKFNWDSEETSFCTSPRRSLDSNIDLVYAFEREYFAMDQIEISMGLREFDGHEGLDSEFNGDRFVLEESLQ